MIKLNKLDIYKLMYTNADIMDSIFEDDNENVKSILAKEYPDMTDEEVTDVMLDFRTNVRNLLALMQEALFDYDTYKVVFDPDRKTAYEFACTISAGYSYEEFVLFMDMIATKLVIYNDYCNKNELTEEELDEVVGGTDVLEILAKWFGFLARLSGHCFTEKVTIKMADGTEKSIKDVTMGDKIISLDRNHKPYEATVTYVLKPAECTIYEIVFADGRKLETTESQWLFSGEDDFPIIGAEGMNVLLLDGSKTKIVSITNTGRSELVYDLTVDGDTNYMFVNGIAAEGIGT